MNYRPKPETIEAVKFDSIHAALAFLQPGEFNVVRPHSVYLLTEYGNIQVYKGETYLVRRNGKITYMDAETFEHLYERDEVLA